MIIGCLGLVGCGRLADAATQEPDEKGAPLTFLKGQIHVHTDVSGDGKLSLPDVVERYRKLGYDFLVVTDHNQFGIGSAALEASGLLVLAGVELTQNFKTCLPPPLPGQLCLIHVNALLIAPSESVLEEFRDAIKEEPTTPQTRVSLYLRGLTTAKRLGGIAQLNHPNLYFGADASITGQLAREGLVLLEVANQGELNQNRGDPKHPSTEAIWDAALSEGAHLFATASDDFHQIGEEDHGFVMVRAKKNSTSIREALLRGDFYASTGVLLSRCTLERRAIDVETKPSQGPASFEVIGPKGKVVWRTQGSRMHFDPSTTGLTYVRVRVSVQGKQAWTQPVWLSK